jgi:thiamine-monophosphate kinase
MQLAVTTDMLVEGTHFLPGTDPEALGWKTLAVNISDLAAMGATPRWVLLAGSLPDDDESWLAAFARGAFACADAYGVDLVGGDTTRGPRNFCVTALGEVAPGRALTRAGAQAGDDVWVSGRPGLAALGLAALQGRTELPADLRASCIEALQRPQPRVALGLALVGLAHAAIDVSDGLLADLGHILERSGLAADIELAGLPPLPEGVDSRLARRCQLAGGDDYELVFAAPATAREALAALASRLGLPLSRCGRLVPAAAGAAASANPATPATITVRDPAGRPVAIESRGYDHFA